MLRIYISLLCEVFLDVKKKKRKKKQQLGGYHILPETAITSHKHSCPLNTTYNFSTVTF